MTSGIRPKVRKRNTKVQGKIYTYWMVDCGFVDGKRKTFQFTTKTEARETAEEVYINRNSIGKDAVRRSEEQTREALQSFRRLNGQGSLVRAVEFYISHSKPEGGEVWVGVLYRSYLDSKKKAGRREATLQNMKTRIGRLAKDFADTPVHQITTHDLEK